MKDEFIAHESAFIPQGFQRAKNTKQKLFFKRSNMGILFLGRFSPLLGSLRCSSHPLFLEASPSGWLLSRNEEDA